MCLLGYLESIVMQNVFKSKLCWITLSLLVLGVIFISLENIFYQYLDEDNVLH